MKEVRDIPVLLILKWAICVVLFVFLNNLILNLLENKKFYELIDGEKKLEISFVSDEIFFIKLKIEHFNGCW